MGQYDNAWKDIIKLHFKDFLDFYFPEVSQQINWQRPPEFLDKELQKIHPKDTTQDRYADLLVKVALRNDGENLFYCHIEVQNNRETAFTERLFHYTIRIYERLHSFPVSLVVLTDDDPAFYPDAFEITTVGRYVRVEFQVTKLLYFEEHQAKLLRSRNPFAYVTIVQLEVNALKRRRLSDANARFVLKKRLIMRLFRAGFKKGYIRSLLLFLDWMLQLPKEIEHQLTDEVDQEMGGKRMAYITSWERIGLERGLQKGKLEEKRDILMRQLDKKFSLANEERKQIEQCEDVDKLDAAIDAFVFAETKTEVLQQLD